MTESVVEFAGAGRRYGSVHALEALDLTVRRGEVLALLGHNGAGKSTAMKLVLGVIASTSGSVRVFGRDPRGAHSNDLRMQLGYLPENVSFYDQLSGREVMRYFARLKRRGGGEADQLLERVGLMEAANRRVRTYSKGMRQRLGVAQALLGNPSLLLLDEPTVGLDPIATQDFYGMLDELRGRGVSIVLCSHVLPGVEAHIDRAAILAEGRLRAVGTLDELRRGAGLPLTIRVRGRIEGADLERRLAGEGVALDSADGGELVFLAPPAAKLETLRALLAAPGVEDIDIDRPTLESLYNYFEAGRAAEAEGSQ